jgi:glycolate oxidase iron-sulfur subunit
MRTEFAEGRLRDPRLREADAILRTCVHCGFCLATCPTYLLLGDELDSPRGRIYLAKTMLESGKPATAPVVKHLDRCLTCLSCMTTCPSGVDYAHLIEQAREHIEHTHARPWRDRLLRRTLATIVPNPGLFRIAALAGRIARPLMRPFSRWLPSHARAMLTNAPRRIGTPSWVDRPQVIPAEGERRMRMALLAGCAQQVLRPEINEATVRVLTRHGCEVVIARGAGCCGAVLHQLEYAEKARASAKINIEAWRGELETGGLDAIVFNASGCGVAIRDYGHLLAGEADWMKPAAQIATLARDVTEVLLTLGLKPSVLPERIPVTYHAACTMQHGLGLRTQSKALLEQAGFVVREPDAAHICCGSAGTYSVLQPELSEALRRRKLAAIKATAPAVVAAGNIGCIAHLSGEQQLPVVHTVELLDWATGGPKPVSFARQEAAA